MGKYRVPLLVTAGLRCGRENFLRNGGLSNNIFIWVIFFVFYILRQVYELITTPLSPPSQGGDEGEVFLGLFVILVMVTKPA